jgi:hypothetical protein
MTTAAMTPGMNQESVPARVGGAADPGFRVVVFGLPTDREALLRELRRELGLNPVDSRIHVHHLPGIVPDRLSREDAERVAAAIRSIGGDAAAIRAEDWPDLNRAPTVHHVRCTDCGLEVVSQAGTSVELTPWARIRVISVADVPLDGVQHFMAPRTTVIRATPRIKDAQLETRTLRGAEMWIVCDNPWQAFRIDHREMNYEYLGGRLTGSAAANFELFLKDIVERTPHARLTATAQAFIEHARADKRRYASAEEHRKAVELESAREKARCEVEEPSTTDSAREEALMTALPIASPTGLQEAHSALHREIDDMKAWCHEAEEIGQPRFGQLGIRLQALRDHVAGHFAAEERGGYMSPVVSADPRFAVPAEELLAEHARILTRFDEVAAKLAQTPAGYTCWSEGQHDICSVLADLERHEHAENELWQSAFEVETGVGD